MDLCPAIKKNGAKSSKGKLVDAETILLNEMSRLRKTNSAHFSGRWKFRQKGKKIKTEKEKYCDVERDWEKRRGWCIVKRVTCYPKIYTFYG